MDEVRAVNTNDRIEYYIQYPEGMNGVKSRRVRALQEMMFYLGFLTTAPDGQFGPNTKKAVIKAQQYYGFEQNGIVNVSFFQKLAEEVICKNPKD